MYGFLKYCNTLKYPDTPKLDTTDTLLKKMFQYPNIVYYRHTLLPLFNKHWIYFFSHLLTCTNPRNYWDDTLLALVLHL